MSSPRNNGNGGWYKTGKRNKRKGSPLEKAPTTRGVQGELDFELDREDNGQYTDGGDQQSVSSLLSATNKVLYGETIPPTTPIVTMNPETVSTYIAETNKKLDYIIDKLSKLENIEKKLDQLDNTVRYMDQRVVAVETKTCEFEKSVTFMSDKIDDFQKKCKELDTMSDELRKQNQSIKMLCNEIENTRQDRNELRESVTDLKCRSMQYNLVFTGLGGETRDEDTEGKLRDFISQELGQENIELCNVHRFGRFTEGRRRPIVAKFIYYRDLQRIKDHAYRLRGKPYGISEQFPPEIEDRRKVLYPVMRRLRQAGEKPKLVRDRLYVNGKPYNSSFDFAKAAQQNEGVGPHFNKKTILQQNRQVLDLARDLDLDRPRPHLHRRFHHAY
jgi:hypothetical protein